MLVLKKKVCAMVGLLGLSLAALPSLAGTPVALDLVPADSDAVVVVPHFGDFLNDVNALNAVLGEDGQPMLYMVTAMIRGMPGIDLKGSAAGVLEFVESESDVSAKGVVLIPVSDFSDFSNGYSLVDGLFKMPMGDTTLFFRKVSDGYAAIGDDAGRVRDFDGTPGQLDANRALVGKVGNRVMAGNDLIVYFNFDAFADEIAQGRQEMEAQGEMVRMMGGEEASQGFDAFVEMVETMGEDGSVLVGGMNFDKEIGVSFDAGVQFAQGSRSASYLLNDGDAGKYFSKVPEMDYFFATAFDLSGLGVQQLMKDYTAISTNMDSTGTLAGLDMNNLIGQVRGGVQLVGASDNLMGGILNKTMYYLDVDQPDAFIGLVRDAFAQADTGEQLVASVDGESLEINGADAFGYSFGFDMSGLDDLAGGFGGPNPSMIMGMIFGPDGGPSGYLSDVGDGVVSTFSRDADFFSAAIEAAKGNNTLSGDSGLAQTAALLPDNRIFEGYMGADHLINTAGPMLMMFGILPEFEPVDALAPIGVGVTADGGGVMMRAVLPSKTIDTIMALIPEGDDDVAEGNDGDDGDDVGF